MKSSISVFSFSHWGFTQSTNKRTKKVACFYSTNLQTYILYILFASFFTIKYDLLLPYPSKYYLLPVSKICAPPDLFLSLKHLMESQVWLLRCDIRYMCVMFHFPDFLAVQLVPYICILTVYMFSFLLSYCIRQSLLPKKATGRSHWQAGYVTSSENTNFCKFSPEICSAQFRRIIIGAQDKNPVGEPLMTKESKKSALKKWSTEVL